ncbi:MULTISPECIES: hypothetical protein [Chlamydia]|uniref:Uncharacterized protein n=2 Tax=Chlamydia TaxID=810 RepID=A0ABP2X3J6_CHLPS|nr:MULTISPECIES: hypothetical protein [Chlamydia]AFS19326.1 hypothetical protein B595_0356 [Chlamydia psittaci 84/55]AFS22522.1 hypothetical protein B600_0360 [Chlamydia psittaci VS225]AGE74889.1 hypothetical protein AO9_01635 [Chlamydia psittaci Mat116]EPJ15661.1 hypothetical protein CP02DC18_0761 [Chlamydia psittaci 02DC18]EPJ16856.1 hypothetical protein CP02DC22_0757 [Chlamydia psittaci 02DC22]EPJ19997.1 hypothetical protein CP02DC21_0739 [Chlamydia psittaci 02DC21]EPJ21090.1 hypothetical
MPCNDVDTLIQELSSLQDHLSTLDSLDAILVVYEKMFSLIHQGLDEILVKDQQCYLLSVQPNGTLLKDALDEPVLQTFSMTTQP